MAPQPPAVSSNSSRSVPPLSANPFSTNAPGVNHLDLSGPMGPHVSQPSMQMHMPGAFPGESTVPYRRPTDLTTQLSMSNSTISMDHFSGDNVWDSEGDSASCLSTSTTATSVMSDMTEKGDTYNITPTQTATTSRTTTPTQAVGREQPESRSVAETPRPSILRHTGQKSILSNGSKESASSSSTKTMSSSHSSKTYTSSSTSSTARSSNGSAPHIHIEVNRSDSREQRDEARKRQLVEEALVDKIAQLKLEQSQAKEAKSAPTPAPAIKRVPSVRFAEPEKVKAKVEEKPARPTLSEQKNLSKELVQQTKEVQKLELEIEKSKLKAQEKERAELERKLKEEAAELERKKEHERQLKKLQKEKTELENASKEREKAEKEKEKATKEREKAEKEREKARQKERQQIDKKLSDIEKAQKEHDKLQESFIDQGKILADLKTRFDAQAKTLEATEAERAGLQKIKDEFEKRCADLSKTLSHVSDKERFVVEQVASLQIIKESLQARVGPLESRVDEQQREITALHGERDGLYQDVKSYLHRITELENGMKGLVEEKHGLMKQIGALEKEKSGLEDKIRDRDGQIKDRDGQIKNLTNNLEARAKETQQHIASLKDEHKKQMEGLEAAKDALISGMTVGHDLRVQDLEEQISVLNVHIDGAHADVEKFKDTVKSLEVSLSEEKTRVEEEKSKTGVEQSRADTLASERDTLLIQLDGHKLLAVDQEKDLLDLRTKLASSDGELAKLLDSSKALEAEHEELKKRAASLEESTKAEPQPAPADAPPPPAEDPAPPAVPKPTVEDERDVVVVEVAPPAADKPGLEDLQTANQELTMKTANLEAKNAELATQVANTKTELTDRITQLEGERDTAASALIVAQVELNHTKAIADRVPALEEEASKVPNLEAEKAGLEAKVAELEPQASQVPLLRGECARLAEQLAAANSLIAALSATVTTQQQHDAASLNGAHIPLPQSPPPPPASEPADIPIPPSPSLTSPPPMPPQPVERRKVRSRAPSMARSVSSRSSAVSKKSSAHGGAVRDDLALVVVRDSKDRGNVTVVRKCDLRTSRERSRSQGPGKE